MIASECDVSVKVDLEQRTKVSLSTVARENDCVFLPRYCLIFIRNLCNSWSEQIEVKLVKC